MTFATVYLLRNKRWRLYPSTNVLILNSHAACCGMAIWYKQRQIVCAPISAEYWSWLATIQSPSGKLKDAAVYARNQKEVLCAFLSHGEMEISNNQVENAIRPFVVGRKGWLFSDTPRGAKASAIIYSLMETAKANGLNLEKYLYHLLTVLPERLGKSETLWIEDLLPWTQEMQGFAL
ncbi:MAG: transposase [Clostridia bacterium]